MDNSDTRPVDYRTHILIGRTSSGKMMIISEWPHLPRQAEVQQKIDATKEPYTTYLLCTPTSILSAGWNGGGQRRGSAHQFR
jgi:hypothetical protein